MWRYIETYTRYFPSHIDERSHSQAPFVVIGESVTFTSVFSAFYELENTVLRDPVASVRTN